MWRISSKKSASASITWMARAESFGVLVALTPRSHRSPHTASSPGPAIVVADQYADRSAGSVSTTKSHPWLKPALGARTACSSARSTTGCVITVDGGNPAAFPR